MIYKLHTKEVDENSKVEQIHLDSFEKLELEDRNEINSSQCLNINNSGTRNSKFVSENIERKSCDEKSNLNISVSNNTCENSAEQISDMNMIRNVLNIDDSELEKLVSLELWEYYKKIGASIWPSYLRYENPPSHVRTLESRFYLKNDNNSPGTVIYSEFKNKKGGLDYINYINDILRDMAQKEKFKSLLFNDIENTRSGLITYYLITNGLKKNTMSSRCQHCGSSKCHKTVSSCKANRCFKCYLKGHQAKDCTTKFGCFNKDYLVPARAEREVCIRNKNLNDLFSSRKSKSVEKYRENSYKFSDSSEDLFKYCICLDCNKMGHSNCNSKPAYLSELNNKQNQLILKKRFILNQEIENSSSQQARKSNALFESDKLFNISYLLNFMANNDKKTNGHVELDKNPTTILNYCDNNPNLIQNSETFNKDGHKVPVYNIQKAQDNGTQSHYYNYINSKDNINLNFNNSYLHHLSNHTHTNNFFHSQIPSPQRLSSHPRHFHNGRFDNNSLNNYIYPSVLPHTHVPNTLSHHSPINLSHHHTSNLSHPSYCHQNFIQTQANNYTSNYMSFQQRQFNQNNRHLQNQNDTVYKSPDNVAKFTRFQHNIDQNRSFSPFSINRNITPFTSNNDSYSFSVNPLNQIPLNSIEGKTAVTKKRRKFNNGLCKR